jgi:hypothetical protein
MSIETVAYTRASNEAKFSGEHSIGAFLPAIIRGLKDCGH